MKYILLSLNLFVNILIAQTLTPSGMETITVTTELSKTENFEKIRDYTENYLVNESTAITSIIPNESVSFEGKTDHAACYINTTMGSKTCFELQFEIQVIAKNKEFEIHVVDLKAVNNDRHPGKSYPSWFDEEGKPYPALQSCVDGTTAYFLSYKDDFVDYIENGDYW